MRLIKTLTLVFALISCALHAQESKESTAPKIEHPDAPQWTLSTQDGKQISFSDYAGKPVIITFWGTWCPYCKKLHPGLEKVRAKYEEQGLVVLGISVNEQDGAKPQDFLTKNGIHFLTLVEGDDIAEDAFQVFGTPTTLFISPQGKILGRTMESNPEDPRFDKIAAYLVGLQD
ncbi:TlpA family protein disulfide reductase [Glaciecola sp. MH2013]|nr:TlpA family protein disulfide reductase [Glaciecola sp. MH2013]